MKIGKENMMGLTQAVERVSLAEGSESGASMKHRLEPFISALNQIIGLSAISSKMVQGETFIAPRFRVQNGPSAMEVIRN